MKKTHLISICLLTAYHIGWAMELSTQSVPKKLTPETAQTPSGLTLEQDAATVNSCLQQLPKTTSAALSNLKEFESKIVEAQTALLQYLHNPAIDPKINHPDIKIQRFSAGIILRSLTVQQAGVQYLLSPEGQKKLQEYKQQEGLKARQRLIYTGVGIAAIGSLASGFFSNL